MGNQQRAAPFLKSVLSYAVELHEEQEMDWPEATRDSLYIIANAELHHTLGFDLDVIDRFVRFGHVPSDDLIKKRIAIARENQQRFEPLDVGDYKRLFKILIVISDVRNIECNQPAYEDEDAPDDWWKDVHPNDWVSLGIALGAELYLVGADSIDITSISAWQSKMGRKRAGRRYSIPKYVIDKALSDGLDSSGLIADYLDGEPQIDEIDVFVERSSDGWDFHSFNGKHAPKHLKATSLASTISAVKRDRRNRLTFTGKR